MRVHERACHMIFRVILILAWTALFFHSVAMATVNFDILAPMASGISQPEDVAIGPDNTLAIVDAQKNKVLIYNSGQQLINSIAMASPTTVAISGDGRILVGRNSDHSVRIFNSQGEAVGQLGKGAGEFLLPRNIVIHPSTGNIYVVDQLAQSIRVYTSNGSFLTSINDSPNLPQDIAIAGSELFVIDQPLITDSYGGTIRGARVQVFDLAGKPLRNFGTYGTGQGQLFRPKGIAADSQGILFVSDSFHGVVLSFTRDGVFLGNVQDPDHAMLAPLGTGISGDNRLLVASSLSAELKIFKVTALSFPGGDACPNNPSKDMTDTDHDGVRDVCDNCKLVPNFGQLDSDLDGVGDACDGCPYDPNKTAPGVCGCGVADIDADGDGYPACVDCNDHDPQIHPGAEEVCDGIDNNCNGLIDEGVLNTYYRDADGDGYGDPLIKVEACSPPPGYVTDNTDCDDANVAVNPGSNEIKGNGVDDDCNLATSDDVLFMYSLYFPAFYDGQAGWQDYLTVQGLNAARPVNISVNFYNNDGTLWFSDEETIAVGGRYNMTPNWAKFGSLQNELFNGSAVVEADQPVLGMTNSMFGVNGDAFNIAGAAKARTEHYFPKAYDGFSGWSNLLMVQNIDAVPREITVKLFTAKGVAAGTATATIPPFGKYEVRPKEIAKRSTFNGVMQVSADQPVAAMLRCQFRNKAIAIHESAEPKEQHFFAEVYDGFGRYSNYLVFQNPSNTAIRRVSLFYYDKTGGLAFTESKRIPPNGRHITTPSMSIYGELGHDFSGSVIASADGPVAGIANTITADNEAIDVYNSNTPALALIFPKSFDGLGGWNNFISIFNQNAEASASIAIELFDADGKATGTKNFSIPPHGRYRFQPSSISGAGFNGSIKVTSDHPVCGTNRYENTKALSVYEAFPLPR